MTVETGTVSVENKPVCNSVAIQLTGTTGPRKAEDVRVKQVLVCIVCTQQDWIKYEKNSQGI